MPKRTNPNWSVPEEPPEADWKAFRQFREAALERFYARVTGELVGICSEEGKSHAERYAAARKEVTEAEEVLLRTFDNPRRSQMYGQLAGICAAGLIDREQLERFSSATRERVEILCGWSSRT